MVLFFLLFIVYHLFNFCGAKSGRTKNILMRRGAIQFLLLTSRHEPKNVSLHFLVEMML